MLGRRLSVLRSRLAVLADRRGGIGLIAAIAIPVLLGMASLVGEYGHSLLIKTDDQRIADLAAYAGGLAYTTNNTTASMTSAAQAVAALNGVAAGNVAAALIASPSGDGNQSVKVTISTNMPLYLAEMLGAKTSLPVSSAAYAEIKAAGSGCIIALNSGGTGVTLSGGTSVTANQCAVASNATVTVPCGTTVTTPTIDYNSSAAPSAGCSGGIKNASGGATTLIKTVTADPLASNTEVSAATARLSTVAAMTSPTIASVPAGCALSFDFNNTPQSCLVTTNHCTDNYSNGTYNITCAGGGPYNFSTLTLQGGTTVTFTTSASATYTFSGLVNNTGSALTFGAGNYTLAQGLSTGGGTTTTFGAGTFNIGAMTSSCNGATYSICHTGTALTFGGPSTFVISKGIYVGGGETMTMGAGSTNSYQIGASSGAAALFLNGGSKLFLANATGASDLFQLNGAVNVSSGGGSCLTLPAATQHDINGVFNVAGGVTLGTGVYTINGYVAAGASGGGDVTCNGVDTGVAGTGVTLVISGTSTASGNCSGQVFCLGAGYSNVSLTAPSSGSYNDLLVVGPTSGAIGTAGAMFTAGASNATLSGAFYFPKGPVSLNGGASLTYGAGGCLQIIGTQVTLSGGTSAASDCTGLGNTGTASVALVQ